MHGILDSGRCFLVVFTVDLLPSHFTGRVGRRSNLDVVLDALVVGHQGCLAGWSRQRGGRAMDDDDEGLVFLALHHDWEGLGLG